MTAAESTWRPVGVVQPVSLVDVRLQTHHAAQWLARAARVYVPAEADDSHTSLTWDADRRALLTQPVTAGLRFALDIAGMRLLAIGPGTGTEVFALGGRSDGEAGTWMDEIASSAGLDAHGLHEPLPWEMPAHPVASGGTYSLSDGCAELSNWFHNGDVLLASVRKSQASVRPGPSPVRCWPHHFDIATLITLGEGDAEEAKSVGVGLSPGDGSYPEPYIYISPWPYPDANSLPVLPAGGHWHTDGFTAAVATASELLALPDGQASIHSFVLDSVQTVVQNMGS